MSKAKCRRWGKCVKGQMGVTFCWGNTQGRNTEFSAWLLLCATESVCMRDWLARSVCCLCGSEVCGLCVWRSRIANRRVVSG